MNHQDRSTDSSSRRWLERISLLFGGEPQDREQLFELLQESRERQLMDQDALHMMRGAMLVSELRVRDIMIPRSQLVLLHRDDDLEEVLRVAIESAHSRIPVTGKDTDEVEGIFLPKDMLGFLCQGKRENFQLGRLLRAPLFVPESMRLNKLLKTFRNSRNHLAIVVDEYGSTAGLVTMENVLEQIVGEIEDEHDEPTEQADKPLS